MTRTARSRSRLGPLFTVLILAGALLVFLYGRCGAGFGFGGGGEGHGGDGADAPQRAVGAPGPAPAPAAPAHLAGRCQLRLDQRGLALDGAPADRAAAVAACRTRDGADLIVTGDALRGDADALRAALEGASIPVFVR